MSDKLLETKTDEALAAAGTPAGEALPYLRGYVLYGTDPGKAAKALDKLLGTDDERDLMMMANNLIKRFGRDALAGKGDVVDKRLNAGSKK